MPSDQTPLPGPETVLLLIERLDPERPAKARKVSIPKRLQYLTHGFGLRTLRAESSFRDSPRASTQVPVSSVGVDRLIPREDRAFIQVPDATPETVRAYDLEDEQALLVVVRYNRLVELFLGFPAVSVQDRFSTTGIGETEIDELYAGVGRYGDPHVIPVHATRMNQQISALQTPRDLAWCAQKYPGIRCRALSIQLVGPHRPPSPPEPDLPS